MPFFLLRFFIFSSLMFSCGPGQMAKFSGSSKKESPIGGNVFKAQMVKEHIGHKKALSKNNPGYSSFKRQSISSKVQVKGAVYTIQTGSENIDCSLPVGTFDNNGNPVDVGADDQDSFINCNCQYKACRANMGTIAFAVQKKKFKDYKEICQILKDDGVLESQPTFSEDCGIVRGCTEPEANGFVASGSIVGAFDPKANEDDGSCRFTACSARSINYQILHDTAVSYAEKFYSDDRNFQLSSIFADIKNSSAPMQCNIQVDPCFINGTCKEVNQGCNYKFPSNLASFNQFVNNYSGKWYDSGVCQYDLNTYSTTQKAVFQQTYTTHAKYFSPSFSFDTKVPGVNLRNTSGMGCTDQMAYNYEANVTSDDCSCKFDACTDSAYEEFTYDKTVSIYTNVGSYINTNRCNEKNPNAYIVPESFPASCTRTVIPVENIQSCNTRTFSNIASLAGMASTWATTGSAVGVKYLGKVSGERLFTAPGEFSGNFKISFSRVTKTTLGLNGRATLILGGLIGDSFSSAVEVELSNDVEMIKLERREDKLFVFKNGSLFKSYLLTENSCCYSKDTAMTLGFVLKGETGNANFNFALMNKCGGADINSPNPTTAQTARACQWREDNNTAKSCSGSIGGDDDSSTDSGSTDSGTTDGTTDSGSTDGTTDSGSTDGDDNGGTSEGITHGFSVTKLDTTVPYLTFTAGKYNHQGSEDYLVSVGIPVALHPKYSKSLEYEDYRIERLGGVDCIGRAHYRYDGWTCDVKVGSGKWFRKQNAVTCICIPNDPEKTPSLEIKNCVPQTPFPVDPPNDPPVPPTPPNPPENPTPTSR